MANSDTRYYIHKVVHFSGHYHITISKDPRYKLSTYLGRLRLLKAQKQRCRTTNYPVWWFVITTPVFKAEDFEVITLNEDKPFKSYAAANQHAANHAKYVGTNYLLTSGVVAPRDWDAYVRCKEEYLKYTREPVRREEILPPISILEHWAGKKWPFSIIHEHIHGVPTEAQAAYFGTCLKINQVDLTANRAESMEFILTSGRFVRVDVVVDLPFYTAASSEPVRHVSVNFVSTGYILADVLNNLYNRLEEVVLTHTPDSTYKWGW